MTIAERVRALRKKAAVSARELSALAGLSPAYITLLERRPIEEPALSTLEAVALVLGADISYLSRGHGTAPSQEAVRAAVNAARAQRKARAS